MRMHVSIPPLLKCICYAMHTQKVTFILVQKVVRKTQKNKLGLGYQIIHDWQELLDDY
jgi:hypothetical protein